MAGYGPAGGVPAPRSQAVTALVLSILGLPFCCGPLSFVGLFLGRSEMKAIDRGAGDPSKRGLAQAAFVLGIIGAAFFVLSVVGYLLVVTLAVASS
jgi:hypothetical protein